MTVAISVRPMLDEDVPEVAALLTSALGPGPGGVDRAGLFRWKHLSNPFGRSIALVAELDGEIIGLRSFMRWRFEGARGAEVSAVRAVDTATSPAHQRSGVFSRLTNEALAICRDEGVDLIFNTPNDKSRPGYLKLGWQEVGTWSMSVRSRRPARLLRAAIAGRTAAGSPIVPTVGSDLTSAARALDELSSLNRWVGRPGSGPLGDGLVTSRSAAYLRWRYSEGPIPYLVLGTDETQLVARARSRGDLRELVICEAFAAPGEERALRALLRRAPREAGCDHAVAHLGSSRRAKALLVSAGYLPLPGLGMTFTVLPLGAVRPDPTVASSWALTLGDLELF